VDATAVDTGAAGAAGAAGTTGAAGAAAAPPPSPNGTKIYSTFAGSVEVVDVLVRVGDKVTEGAVIAEVEAMKAKHDIRSPRAGTVSAVHVSPGREIDSTMPIVTIA
jgi:biotin carboxyl carrier protein